MTSVEELLHAAALRALDEQERHVAELRSRAGTLLAALSASFLGATAVEHAGFTTAVVVSILALAWMTALCLLVMAPVRMSFAVDVPTLDDALQGEMDDERVINLKMAYWLHGIWSENELVVRRLNARFSHAALVLAVDVGLWMLALALG
jgi:hypothetical protein